MAPVAQFVDASPALIDASMVVVVSAVIVISFVVLAAMCACGGKKEKAEEIPPAEDKPAQSAPAAAKEASPEPAAAAPAPAEPKSEKGKSAKKAPASGSSPSSDSSVRMKEAHDLQLMSKLEGPRGDQSVKLRGAVKGEMPSLMLTGQSVVAPSPSSSKASTPSKSVVQKGPASKSVSVADRTAAPSVSVNAKSMIGAGAKSSVKSIGL